MSDNISGASVSKIINSKVVDSSLGHPIKKPTSKFCKYCFDMERLDICYNHNTKLGPKGTDGNRVVTCPLIAEKNGLKLIVPKEEPEPSKKVKSNNKKKELTDEEFENQFRVDEKNSNNYGSRDGAAAESEHHKTNKVDSKKSVFSNLVLYESDSDSDSECEDDDTNFSAPYVPLRTDYADAVRGTLSKSTD